MEYGQSKPNKHGTKDSITHLAPKKAKSDALKKKLTGQDLDDEINRKSMKRLKSQAKAERMTRNILG